MNRTAKAIGMKSSTFKNANGLTAEGHLSTARDMTVLGRRLFYDFPQYYNIFSRRTTDAGIATVSNTNRRFLDSYKGADGIKTGYTNPAGFNLTASAERGNKRIIATVFGGKSTAHRNAKMAELLDLGFGEAPANAPVKKPGAPDYEAVAENSVADPDMEEGGAGKTIRVVMAVKTSVRPKHRPTIAQPSEEMLLAMQDGIAGALAEATSTSAPAADAGAGADATAAAIAEAVVLETPAADTAAPAETAVAEAGKPDPDAVDDAVALALAPEAEDAPAAQPPAQPEADVVQNAALSGNGTITLAASPAPRPRPLDMYADAEPAAVRPAQEPEVVTRLSTSGGRHWGINVGRYGSRGAAERQLLKVALAETVTLNEGMRKVVVRSGEYDANFVGLTQEQADLACRRLQARSVQCFTMGP
jgi:D-alanyl-D-alanine carboxypeptidase